MYYDFDCHFKQDQKNQSDMVDPVFHSPGAIAELKNSAPFCLN